MSHKTIRIATRKSPLAMWQAEHVTAELKKIHPNDNREDPYQLEPITGMHSNENEIMQELDLELQEWLDKMHDPFRLY